MSNQINDGGSAFPCVYYSDPIGSIGSQLTIKGGMTLRDYFAASALQGMNIDGKFSAKTYASDAYQMADAMLKAMEAKP